MSHKLKIRIPAIITIDPDDKTKLDAFFERHPEMTRSGLYRTAILKFINEYQK